MTYIKTVPRVKPVDITAMNHGDKFLNGGEIVVLLDWAFDSKNRNVINVKYIPLHKAEPSRYGCFFHGQHCLKYLGEVVPRRTAQEVAA